jgi:outer membrane protein assembly factor BamB
MFVSRIQTTALTLSLTLALTLPLTACSGIGGMFGKEDEPLPGKRLSVLELESELQPDSLSGDVAPIALPELWENAYWPQRGGYPNHAMQNLALPNKELAQVWKASIGKGGSARLPLTAQPVVVNGMIYTLDAASDVTAFNIQNGKQLWKVPTRPEGEDEAAIGGGVAFGESALYVTNGFGELLAVSPRQGNILWRQRLPSPARAAPTVKDNIIYVQLLDNTLIAMSATAGTELWRYSAFTEDSGFIGAASPAVDQNIVLAAFSSGEITGLQSDTGAAVWSDTLAPRRRLGGMSSLSDVTALPVIDKNIAFGVGFGGRMSAFDLQTGRRIWQREIGGTETPWIAGNTLYQITRENELTAIDRMTGQIRWVLDLQRLTKDEDTQYWTGPVMGGGRLIIASNKGTVAELSPQNGELLRTMKAPGAVSLPPVIAGNTLYILSDNGTVAAYR